METSPLPQDPHRTGRDALAVMGPAEAEQEGRRIAGEWSRAYRPLLEQMRDDPGRLLLIFLEEAYPDISRSPAPHAVPTRDGLGLLVEFQDALPPGFRRALLSGIASAAGVELGFRSPSSTSETLAWEPHRSGTDSRRLAELMADARLPFLAATLLPVLVAVAVAAQEGPVAPGWAILTLLGVAVFHLAANAMNEFYAATSRRTDVLRTSPFDAAGVLGAPRRTPEQLRRLAYALYGVGIAIGLTLVAFRGIEVLWLGLAGFLLGLLYAAPPVRLAHRGLGELAVAIGFGPLIVLGAYFVQRQTWSIEAFLAGLPLAFLIAAVLYIHEFPDKQGDAQVGKRTLIVRLPERTAVVLYMVLLALTYLVIFGGVSLNAVPRLEAYAFPAWSLLGLATLPLAVRASVFLARNYRLPYRLVSANSSTVLLHVTTGSLFCTGYLLAWLA